MSEQACFCGSGKLYHECCGPIINGTASARTPEELMRARYSAHCQRKYDFLVTSTHPAHREDMTAEGIGEWAQHVQWTGLEVHSATPGETPGEGFVSFTAHYSVRDIEQELREDAVFQQLDGQWYYVDGKVQGEEPYVRSSPKVGRNDPCPCGSGKKYKKCCGQ